MASPIDRSSRGPDRSFSSCTDHSFPRTVCQDRSDGRSVRSAAGSRRRPRVEMLKRRLLLAHGAGFGEGGDLELREVVEATRLFASSMMSTEMGSMTGVNRTSTPRCSTWKRRIRTTLTWTFRAISQVHPVQEPSRVCWTALRTFCSEKTVITTPAPQSILLPVA